MRTIWKYPVPSDGEVIDMPEGARIVHVDVQGTEACLWAEVETDRVLRKVQVGIIGTGRSVPDGWTYIGTFQAPPFVWHVYRIGVPR